MKRGRVRQLLLADPDLGRQATVRLLLDERLAVTTACSVLETLECVATAPPDVAVLSDTLTEVEPRQLLALIRARAPACATVAVLGGGGGASVHDLVTLDADMFLLVPFRIDQLLSRLDAVLLQRGEEPCWRRRLNPRVARVLTYVADHYTGMLTVESVARAVALSSSRLGHLFRSEMAMTLRDWVTRLRVEVAKRVLLETEDKLDAVAEGLGFCDAPHFSRVFRHRVGLWPGDYRRFNARVAGARRPPAPAARRTPLPAARTPRSRAG